MKNKIVSYITKEIKKLKYKGDNIILNNVYPSIIEDVLGNFDNPYTLNGYDCDYSTTVGKYKVSGSMRFGTAEITLMDGDSREDSVNNTVIGDVAKNDSLIKNEICLDDLTEDELKELNTYYFTFGIGQNHEGMYQPIMARNIRIASEKMFDMYGTKWSDKYTQEEWNEVLDYWGVLYEGKNLEVVIAL